MQSNPVIDFSVYMTERTLGFTGRDWVLQAIDAWLADPAGARFFLLTGEPGAGKTAVAARLARISSGAVQPPDGLSHVGQGFLGAVHFCSVHDRRWINPHVFAESLTQQLSERYAVYARAVLQSVAPTVNIHQEARENWGRMIGAQIETLIVTTNPEDLFNRVVREPLEALARSGPARPTVILVDALDESLAYTGRITISDLVAQADDLSPAVRFILTCRPETDLLRSVRRRSPQECTISPRHAGSEVPLGVRAQVLQDVQDYIQRVTNEEGPAFRERLPADLSLQGFVITIRDRSEGNFLYVRHVLRTLIDQRQPITRESLAKLPTGLDGIYLEFLQRLVGKSTEVWNSEYGKILGVLAVCQVPLTEDRISDYTALRPATVRSAMTKLRELLETDDDALARQRDYSLYHSSFAEFLLDSDRAEEYWLDSITLHRLIALHYWNAHRADWRRCDDYGLTYIATHLFEGGDVERLQSLVDEDWISTRYERRNYSYDGLLGDIELAWRAAERTNTEQVASCGCVSYLAEEVRWALCIASIGTLIRNIPADLLGALIREGEWSPIQGLAHARHVPAGEERVKALATLAPHLPEPFRSEAFGEAAAAANHITNTEQRTQMLTWLLPYLPEGLRPETVINAITAVRELKDQRRIAGGYGTNYASSEGTRYVNTGVRTKALSELSEALADLTEPRLSAAEIVEQIQAFCTWEDEDRFRSAVAEAATRLGRGPSGFLGPRPDAQATSARASIIAQTRIGDEDERAEVAEAFETMKPEDTEAEQAKKLSALRFSGPYFQSRTLVALAPHLSVPLLRDALELAQKISDSRARARALSALAPHLPEPLLREVLFPISRGFAETLTSVAPHLPEGLLREVLESVQGIDDGNERARALAVLSPYLPEPLASEVLASVRSAINRGVSNSEAYRTVAALAPYLPEALAIEAFAAVRDIKPSDIHWNYTPLLTMLALAPRLPEPQRSDAVTRAFRAAKSLTSGSEWNDTVISAIYLARQLPQIPRAKRLINALATHAVSSARKASAGRNYPGWLTRRHIELLIMLLPYLPEPQLAEAARAVVRLIVEDSADTLSADQTATLAQYLPERFLLDAEPAITKDALPSYLPEELLPEALKVATRRKNVRWLFAATGRLTDSMLGEALRAAREIGGAALQAELMAQHSDVFSKLEPVALYAAWSDTLHGMASLNRQTFLRDIRDLGPIVTALGGRNATEAVLRAVHDVGRWWP